MLMEIFGIPDRENNFWLKSQEKPFLFLENHFLIKDTKEFPVIETKLLTLLYLISVGRKADLCNPLSRERVS
jgi:hypothetical protein